MAGKFTFLIFSLAVLTLTAVETQAAPPSDVGPLSSLLAAISGRRACDDYEPQECPDVDGEFPVFLPDDDDCRRFYECSNGMPILKDCSPGLHFDRWNHICDQPAVAGCEDCTFKAKTGVEMDGEEDLEKENGSDESDDSSSEEQDCPPEYSEHCPEVDGQYAVLLPNPDSCSSFIMCSNGVPYTINCPDGLEFSLKTRVCDWPYRANCTPCGGGSGEDSSSSSSSSEEYAGDHIVGLWNNFNH
ncbi:peritrophin-1-like [Ischnura elegans]|uniref:peritrophin-1-like n=1 Tax=Ischnura elegans TaxID=197161 RepID=UPI001ED88521|nr:peritrophin-1-like [Ischnura elegans]